MIFDRYRKPKRIEEPNAKKTSIADTLLRKLPISFTRRTKSKATLIDNNNNNNNNHDKLPRHSTSLPNITLDSNIIISSSDSTTITTTTTNNNNISMNNIISAKKALQSRPSLIFEDILIKKRHTIQPIERKKLTALLNKNEENEENEEKVEERNNNEKDNNENQKDEKETKNQLDDIFNSHKYRHSYTFGHKKGNDLKKNISLNDLLLDASQVKKLELFIAQRSSSSSSTDHQDDDHHHHPPKLLPPVLNLVVPQRSVSHQIISSPKKVLIRAHSTSSTLQQQQQQQQQAGEYHHTPLDAIDLKQLLEKDDHHIILIDVRNLMDYQKQRIRNSLNVNLPTLLIKRYQRGTVSNFHLENFITTAEGRDQYLAYKQSLLSNHHHHSSTDTTSSSNTNTSSSSDETILSSSPSSLSNPLTPMTSYESTNSSVLEKKAQQQKQQLQQQQQNENENKKETIWVVYDDTMDENNRVTQAWTLLNVLCKATKDTNDKVHYLKNGFQGFINDDYDKWLEGTFHLMDEQQQQSETLSSLSSSSNGFKNNKNRKPLTISTSTSSDTRCTQHHQNNSNSKVFPRRSLSYTVGDGSKVLQQTSLFSLDTQAARENNAHALARRASRKSQQLQINASSSIHSMPPPPTPTIKSTFSKMNKNNHHHKNNNNEKNNNISINNSNNQQQQQQQQQQQDKYNTTLSSSTLSIPSSSSLTSSSILNTSSSLSTASTSSLLASNNNNDNNNNNNNNNNNITTSNTSLSSSSSSSSSSGSININSTETTNQLSQVLEEEIDEDEEEELLGQLTTDTSPRTDSDFEFVISEIIPNFLYVGPEIETKDQAEQLLTRPIKRILNMAEECQDLALLEYQHNLLYRKIAAQDTVEMKNIDRVIMEAVAFIEEAKKNHEAIYVHCKAGKSRSVTAILAYLVSCEKWTLKRSYRHIIKARPNMSPNIGFIAELMKLENQVHGRVSSFLETDWQTAALPSPDFTKELKQLQHAWSKSPSTPTVPTSFSTITH